MVRLNKKFKNFINEIHLSLSMAKKGPRTLSGMMNKAITGDGRKKASSMFNGLLGEKKKKK
jgi:hypothetical protein